MLNFIPGTKYYIMSRRPSQLPSPDILMGRSIYISISINGIVTGRSDGTGGTGRDSKGRLFSAGRDGKVQREIFSRRDGTVRVNGIYR